MAATHDNGGPAAPVNEINPENGHWDGVYEVVRQHRGLTILDYFAGQAMAALVAHATPAEAIECGDDFATAAYSLAADMLDEKIRRDSGEHKSKAET